VVVAMFPDRECHRGRIEVLAVVAPPEFLLVDPRTAFDLAVLLRTTWADIAYADPEVLAGQREGERELGARCRPESCESETGVP
jgi:hypothetical protein